MLNAQILFITIQYNKKNAYKSVSLNAPFGLHKVRISSAYKLNYYTQITMTTVYSQLAELRSLDRANRFHSKYIQPLTQQGDA